MAHPIVESFRELLIAQAVDAWAGAEPSDARNSEYLRAQSELIANSTGAFAEDEYGIDAPLAIAELIISRI